MSKTDYDKTDYKEKKHDDKEHKDKKHGQKADVKNRIELAKRDGTVVSLETVASSSRSKEVYHFDTYEARLDDFNQGFSNFLNDKADQGWEHDNCQFSRGWGKMTAMCLFEKD